jgi:PhnB protein
MPGEADMQPISPYLTVKDAAAAIEFYKKAFDAVEHGRHPAEDGKRLMHASLGINGGEVMLSDEFPEYGGTPAPTPEKPTSVAISIRYGAPAEVDATFAKAVAAGANGWMKPEDTFWGDRFAMLDDPFGHRWMLAAALKQ